MKKEPSSTFKAQQASEPKVFYRLFSNEHPKDGIENGVYLRKHENYAK